MRLLYVTTVGATMGFFKSLICRLIEAHHTVDIATNESESNVPDCFREWGCKVYGISCTRSPLSKGVFSAVREIETIVRQGGYDIVHCHTPIAAACTRIACRSFRKNGLKVFYTAHGFHFYKGAPLKNWVVFYPIEWLCAHWTDVLITINKEDFERAKKEMHALRVAYVPGVGIDTKRFAETTTDRARKRLEIGVPEDATLLLSVGELNENKNHSAVIRAVARMEDAGIHYAVAGNGALQEELALLAETLNVRGQVHLLGYRQDVAELYKAADVFVFPSIREGLPVSVMEAMAAGLPIVAAKNRGTVDLLGESKNPFVERYDDVESFANELSCLCGDAQLRDRLGKANRERSRVFDSDAINKQMADIYQNALQ
jgi:glycosyltransferase involved in cell wall biosynthesis